MARYKPMCTFHLAMGDSAVIATTPVPVSLVIKENGGFRFEFDPDGYERRPGDGTTAQMQHQGWACDDCADKVLPNLFGFRDEVQDNIIAPIVAEENYDEEEDSDGEIIEDDEEEKESEEDYHFPGEDEPEEPEALELDPEDAAAVEAHMAPVGEKVIPEVQEDMAPEFTEDKWRSDFHEGYQPNPKPTPKGEERVALKKWYEGLSDKERGLAGKITPVLSTTLVYYWRKSAAYADGFHETLDKEDA